MFDAIVTEDVWKDLWNVQANRWVKTNLSIGRIINCTPNEGGATNFSIENGNHAATLANSTWI